MRTLISESATNLQEGGKYSAYTQIPKEPLQRCRVVGRVGRSAADAYRLLEAGTSLKRNSLQWSRELIKSFGKESQQRLEQNSTACRQNLTQLLLGKTMYTQVISVSADLPQKPSSSNRKAILSPSPTFCRYSCLRHAYN